jgi:hypothetical protein
VNDTISEVLKTIGEAFVLVVIVVFLFLGGLRATIIPAVAVPVSLIGTFAVLLIIGYSANTVSLLAVVLAIGIVVDDAIVVVENVERVMKEHPELTPAQATKRAMAEITAPIVAITLVLLSVFVADRLHTRPDRRLVPAMRRDHQRRHGDLGYQCPDSLASPLQHLCSAQQRRPETWHHGLGARRHRPDAPRLYGRRPAARQVQRGQLADRAASRSVSISLRCARRRAFCRKRIRAPSSSWFNCRTARRCRGLVKP